MFRNPRFNKESLVVVVVVVEVVEAVVVIGAAFCDINSRGKPEKTYPSFGTDFTHMIDITESLITGNENIEQNVELE